ncbi:MAG: HD domain-containing phosphohydrolase, partial [Chloroflexota bacterium]
ADLPTLARNIVHTLLREFEQSNCSLLLVNKETRELERIAVVGPYAEKVSQAQLSLDKPGLVAKSIRSGRVLNVADVTADPDYVPNWEAARSELVIPLKIGEDVIGALDVQSPEPGAFHANDERLMTIFSERAAFGLERTRLHEQTRRQLGRLESLRMIDLAISNSLDLRVSLNIVLEQVILQLDVDAASVLLFKPGLARLEYYAGRGFRTHEIETTSLRIGEGLAGRAAMEKQVVHAADLSDDGSEFLRREMLRREEFVSYFAVPLIAKGEVKGVLEIFHRKPIRADMDWLNFLDALGWQTAIAVDNALLFEGIQRSNFDLAMAYDETIEGWSMALDLRDKETEGHTQRVTEMTIQLAEAMGFRGPDLVHIRRGALLHDIGKMGVPDHILLKPDALTPEEWVIMKRHTEFAFDMLHPIAYLRPALHIPYCHHEKWDGTGYPRGLAGIQIPLEARLFAIVDVWDAITSDRPYRKKWSKRKALKFIRDQSGKHFDPQVVEKFLEEIIGK